MIEIPLHNRLGEVVGHALVDDEDWPLVSRHTWHLHKHGYVHTRILHPSGGTVRNGRYLRPRHTMLKMHRLILGLDFGDPREPDHINRDKADNRRANLRVGNRALNMQNKSSYRGSSSQHRGVSWNTRDQRWVARVYVDGQCVFQGSFLTEQEAAEAAVRARAEHMPWAMA